MNWQIHHKSETVSTNLDARSGVPGDVFTADYQSAGRGRLNHRWVAPPGVNMAMSVVLDVAGVSPDRAATLPLVVGYSVACALRSLLKGRSILVKWPNDVFLNGKKVCGILCERDGEKIIAGIGINVKPREFPSELADTATFLGVCPQFHGVCPQLKGAVEQVRDVVLEALAKQVEKWRKQGFGAIHPELCQLDFLRGQTLEIARFDGDPSPVRGLCEGIQEDGSLLVGGERIYAGEAHILSRREGGV